MLGVEINKNDDNNNNKNNPKNQGEGFYSIFL